MLWTRGTVPSQRVHFGDDQEYLTMTASFVRHGSPEYQPGDSAAMLQALPASWRHSLGKKFSPEGTPGAYYPARDGTLYAFHFFTYPASVAPLRAWLDGTPQAPRAHQFTNLVWLSLALASLLLLREQPRLFWSVAPLAFFSPVLWFTTYASTETFVFSLGLIALACWASGRVVAAIWCSALAATQYQPLALVPLWLCADQLWTQRRELRARWPRALAALAGAALVFVPGLFYFVHYGTPNLIAREGLASTRFVTWSKFTGLFLDLNGGMLAYTPGLLLLLLVAAGWAAARARRDPRGLILLGVVLLTMFGSTVQRNWNHPTFGISRYVLYSIAPLLWFIAAEIRARAPRPQLLVPLVAAALALQLCVLRADGFFSYRGNDAAHHSALAAYVLERWPALYSPHPEIFCERTVRRCWPDPATGVPLPEYLPAIWRDSRGHARK
ncbi:MAG TPA: hypothetical protein VJR89_28770, partial [Polyangiales bacterium]|nr:hypothetical protein [Polyangiales bacterium]